MSRFAARSMAMNVLQASTWEVLPPSECEVGLRSERIGRIALSVDALPVVLPVYFVYDASAVIFRTHAGSVLDRNCRNTVVAFEVDSHDTSRKAGWSVLAVGVASIVAPTDSLAGRNTQLDRVGAPAGDVIIKIEPGSITGRAIQPPHAVVVTDD
jgi:nitroimidazol reductase NimA-like FMN-containing flavoprotein (pyridoxamine 5'-phosphate oxidase superfamily)